MVASGLCLSRTDEGEIVFVEELLPQEQADVQVKKVKGKILFAEIVELNRLSNYRQAPPCENVERGCGGCDWQHIKVEAQNNFKRDIVLDALIRIGKIDNANELVEKCLALSSEHYRTSARILVEGNKWGFRARHTNEIVPVDGCLVLHQECIQQANDAIYMNSSAVSPVSLRRSPDPLLDRAMNVSQKSFYQSHIDAPQVLVDLIRRKTNEIGKNLVCVDLYSGVGIFALGMALDGHHVISIESNKFAVEDARKNLKDFSVEVIHSNVDDFIFDLDKYSKCDVVIADPSRDGLGREGLKTVLSCSPERIILISCDPAAGARDIKNLIDNNYELKNVLPINMFGHTHHVEMLSVLDLSPMNNH